MDIIQAVSCPRCPQIDTASGDDSTAVNIPKHESTETKPVWSRSVRESRQVSENQLRELILSGGLDDEVLYKVDDALLISDLGDVETLSGNISVAGSLFIRDCPNLKNLSANFSVEEDLFLGKCPGLELLSGSICVNGAICMSATKSLVDVTGNVSAGAWIDLSHCIGLKNISGTVHVAGDLDLYRCLSLEDLTGNITVGEALNLGLCHYLTNLSGALSVGGSILLDECSRLSSLPDWITSLGYSSTGDIRNVDLEFTGLSPALVDQIRSAAAPGMTFRFAKASQMTVDHFQEAGRAFAFWQEQASATGEIPNLDLDWEYERPLLIFLENLTLTSDYKNELSRSTLAQRVMGLLSVLMDDRLRQRALSCITRRADNDEQGLKQALDKLETLA